MICYNGWLGDKLLVFSVVGWVNAERLRLNARSPISCSVTGGKLVSFQGASGSEAQHSRAGVRRSAFRFPQKP